MATDEDCFLASKIDFHEALERLGYSKSQSEKRIKIYKIVAENSTLFCRRTTRKNIDVIIPGSRGEGTGLWGDSDIDMLYVERCVICSYNGTSFGGKSYAPVKFQLDFENVESGYAMLRLISIAKTKTDKQFIWNIRNGLVTRNGHKYLRNDQIFTSALGHHRAGVARQQDVFDDTSGPARRIICELPFMDMSMDRVLAFPCSYSSVLNSWCSREIKNDWPNKALVDKIKDLDVFVVPVGLKGSADEVLQWRISVTLSEQALVHSFNDTQIKLYTALKMLVKHELNPVCDNISSYVVKNVAFWMFEETQTKDLKKEDFGERLIQLLQRLKKSVTWRYLPNYMFPSRNMLMSKIFGKERVELMLRLDTMIGEGPNVLLRCPLVREIIDLPREISQHKIIFLELAEQVTIATFCIPSQHFKLLTEKKVIHKDIFHMAKENIIKMVVKYVIPLIRIYNPYGFFSHLSTMTTEEIAWCLLEGGLLYINKA